MRISAYQAENFDFRWYFAYRKLIKRKRESLTLLF